MPSPVSILITYIARQILAGPCDQKLTQYQSNVMAKVYSDLKCAQYESKVLLCQVNISLDFVPERFIKCTVVKN